MNLTKAITTVTLLLTLATACESLPSQRVVRPAPGIVEKGAALSVDVLTPSRETVVHRYKVRVGRRVFTFLIIRHASGRLEERILEGRTRIALGTVRKLMQESFRRSGKIHPHLARLKLSTRARLARFGNRKNVVRRSRGRRGGG